MSQTATRRSSPAALLDARLRAMHAALDACPTEVPASLSIPAHMGLDTVAERLALGVDHTVTVFDNPLTTRV